MRNSSDEKWRARGHSCTGGSIIREILRQMCPALPPASRAMHNHADRYTGNLETRAGTSLFPARLLSLLKKKQTVATSSSEVAIRREGNADESPWETGTVHQWETPYWNRRPIGDALLKRVGTVYALYNIVTSDQAKTDEHRHLRGALAKCGYQNWTFNKALKPSDLSKKTQKCKPLTNKNKANITIPYVQGVSEKLRRIFQNFNIATNFKPHSTLRQRLVHPKDRPHKGTKANVIYRLKCEEPNCNNTYIGETSRPLKVRYKEHCRPSANGYSSAIFHHLQHNQGHSFKLESTDVLDRETRWWERGVKEAIYERMYNPTLNREGGLRVDLSGTWDLALPAPRTDNT
ncbi:hypothetical protein Bbelb_367670 [Branchiostoma belcheri]|nr:hypothetical protein Bbelb_367670 [Branchiostoma belcheri]